MFLFNFLATLFAFTCGCSVNTAETPPAEQAQAAPAISQPSTPAPTPPPPVSGPVDYTPPAIFVDAKLQVGPWVPTTWNVEEPFINILHASGVAWQNETISTEQLYADGHIDPNTGLLISFPAGVTSLFSTVYFTADDKRIYDGDWVLEWDGDADLRMEFIADELQISVGQNRIEFTRSEATPWHARIRVNRLGPGGLTGLRLFRAENEAALDAGKIYSAAFVENVTRANIVRMMDMQEANRSFIHRIDQLSPMTEHFWNNFGGPDGLTSFAPHKSMPLEAVFALGVEADVEIWHHAPMELGAAVEFLDPSMVNADLGVWAGAISDMAEANITTILASGEWDAYADEFVAALVASGYPANRPLYTTVSNEVWNFALQYNITTRYAWGAGLGYGGPTWTYRHGYGVFMGRWMLALEAALTRAGRSQNIVYVVEGQAANLDTTRQALTGMQTYIEDEGATWTDYAPKIGASVASYWGGEGYYYLFSDLAGADLATLHTRYASEIASDSDGMAKRLADFYIDGPDDVIATQAWVLKRFQEHVDVTETFGVSFIGAYEGGSHDLAPEFFYSQNGPNSDELFAWREKFQWGPEGARVNNSVNDALALAHPGIILSNYVTIGPVGGQPWFDGMADDNLPMQASWAKYYRP
jgi:hypothetical protein